VKAKRKNGNRRSSEKEKGELVRFPPLPRPPAPPQSFRDPRQATADRIIGGLTRALDESLQVAVANTRTGFPAAAVDVGKLKAALEIGLERMDMEQVRERWEQDLSEWMLRVITSWVQRCKHVKLVQHDDGLEVQLETQDDLGYYHYRFDVFAGRAKTRGAP